jgi:hypothetical protein
MEHTQIQKLNPALNLTVPLAINNIRIIALTLRLAQLAHTLAAPIAPQNDSNADIIAKPFDFAI